jgi:2-polyprenyl-3-methyl-5-hydroxy-6-metoxy-1,4-benzoquinol methylase
MRLAERPSADASDGAAAVCSCLLCGGVRQTPVLEALDADAGGLRLQIVRCDACGLCFTQPRPDPADMQRYYPSDYHCHRADAPVAKPDALERWLPECPGRLLDFGCGAGGFLRRMRALGWQVAGIDTAQRVVERLRSRHGLEVYAGTLPHAALADASFDVVTMRQALEHVHAPLAVLRAARRLLRPNGRLLVSVPNFASWAAHWFGADWYGLDLPRHLTHFTPPTLRAMLTAAGCADVAIGQQTHAGWIRHAARRSGRRFLATRLGSTIASRWARILGRAEGLCAFARNP